MPMMKNNNKVIPMENERCEFCDGELEQKRVLARFRFHGETIYIENVPAVWGTIL